jgi:tetratricopeptide (TPR) repeat protein
MRSSLAVILLLGSLSLSHGQARPETTTEAAGFPAIITDSKTGRTSAANVTRLAGGQLYLVAGNGSVAIPASTVSAAEFDLPAPVKQASEAYRAGDIDKAASLYAALTPMRSLTGLTKCNVTDEFLNFADTYRQIRKYAEAEALLDSLRFGDNKQAELRASLIRAFILCDKNQIDKAEELMKDFPHTSSDDFTFPLDRIVRTRIFLARGKYHEAALEAGEAVAVTRIEAPVYPESLYLAAACYEKMGEVLANKKAGMNRAESEKIMDDTIDYTAVGQAVRQELCLLFSKNYWARKEPAKVDELLAAAASITLKTGKKPEGETKNTTQSPEGAKPSEKKEEKPVWDNFLKKPEAKPENEDIDSKL